MGFLKNIFGKVKDATKRSKTLTKVGLTVGGVGLGLEFDVLPLESLIVSEKYAFWLIIIKYSCMSIGSLLVGAGVINTPKDKEETK